MNYTIQVTSIEELTRDTKCIKTTRPEGFTWKAGQYVQLGFGDHGRRPFSIATACDETTSEMEFHVVHTGKGGLSDALTDTLKPGDELEVTEPHGTLTLDRVTQSNPQRLLFICGGTGLAPVKAILDDMKRNNMDVPYTIIHAVRNWASFYAPKVITDHIVIPILSKESNQNALSGYAHEAIEKNHVVDAACVLCGPDAMIGACIERLMELGMDPAAIYHDGMDHALTHTETASA